MDAKNKEFTEDEIKLLKEIDELLDKLHKEPYGTIINPLYNPLPPSGHNYAYFAEKLGEKANEWYAEYSDGGNHMHKLFHTLNKEVSYVKGAGTKTKKEKERLEGFMREATSQIELDIFDIVLRIRQMKEQ